MRDVFQFDLHACKLAFKKKGEEQLAKLHISWLASTLNSTIPQFMFGLETRFLPYSYCIKFDEMFIPQCQDTPEELEKVKNKLYNNCHQSGVFKCKCELGY
jgi:hypothetical protein